MTRARGGGIMKNKRSSKSPPLWSVALVLVVVSCFSALIKPADASSHFRFGTVSWAPNTQTNGVDFTLQLGYKKNYAWGSDLESWKQRASDQQYNIYSSSTTEVKAACDAWDKKSLPRPEGCTALTISPEVGYVIKFPAKALPAQGQCTSPLEVSPTGSGCLPWTEVYGFFMGDGNSRDIELTLTESTEDVYSPLANYIIGTSVFSHTYASADDNGTAWTAFFTGGDRDTALLNNAGGRFRLETQITISGTARSPTASVMPIIPIPKSATGVQFQIMSYDLSDLTKTTTTRDGNSVEYGGVFNYKGATSLTEANNSPAGPGDMTVASSTGILTFNTASKAAGLYNQVVMVENAQGKIPVDFTMYVYEPVSFCDADCVKSTGLSTFADPDGVYDQCTICGNGVTSDYTVCTPVFQSAGCPGTGDQFTGVKPSEDACKTNTAPNFISPTPGIDENGAANPAYPARHVITSYSGADIVFEVAVEDPDSCSELDIMLVNPPANAALLSKSSFTGTTGRPSSKATFVWPAPSIDASLDNRPATSVVCFYAFDKYASSMSPYLHCVDIKIQSGPTVPEQVLTRFGCHMGLLWSPPMFEGATKGRFCFFDKSTDYSNGLTFNKYCSAADYETAMWHNAYVSIEECGQDTCPGKLFVDGVSVKEFTTSWGPQDCTKPTSTSDANGTYTPVVDSKETSVCPEGDCGTCSSSLRIGDGCLNKYHTLSNFDGLVDEFVLYNTTENQAQISQQMFHLPAHLIIDNFVASAPFEDIHKGVVAWYRFNDACASSVESKTAESSSRRRLAEASFSSQLSSYKKFIMEDSWHNKYEASAFAAGDLASPFTYTGTPWQTPTLSAMSVSVTPDVTSVSLEAIGVAKSPFLSCVVMNQAHSHIRATEMTSQDLALAETYTNEYSYYSQSYQASSATASMVGDGIKGYVNCDIPPVPLGRYSIGVSNNMGLSSGNVFGYVQDKSLQIASGYFELGAAATGEYTISAWINPPLTSSKQYIFALLNGFQQVDTAVYIEGGVIKGLKDGFAMPESKKTYSSEWYHIIFTTIFESSSKTFARIYVDGELVSDLGAGASGGQSISFDKILVGGVPSVPSSGVTLEVDEIMFTNSTLNTDVISSLAYRMPVDLSFEANNYLFVREHVGLNGDLKSRNTTSLTETTTAFVGSKSYKAYVPPWNPPKVVYLSPEKGPIEGGTTITVQAQELPDVALSCVFYEAKTQTNVSYTSAARTDGKSPAMTVTFESPSSQVFKVDATKLFSNSVTCVTPSQSSDPSPKKLNVAIVPKKSSSFYVAQSKVFSFELGIIKCGGDTVNKSLTALSNQLGYSLDTWVWPSNAGTVASVQKGETILSSIVFKDGTLAYMDSGILTAKSHGKITPKTWNHINLSVDADGQGTLRVNGTVISTFTTSSRPAGDAMLIACGTSQDTAFQGFIHDLMLDNVAVPPGSSVEYIQELPAIPPPVLTADVCASSESLLRNLTSSLVFSSRTGAYDDSSIGDALDRHGISGLASNLPLSFPHTFDQMLSSEGTNGTLVFWAKLEKHNISTGFEMFTYTASGKAFRGPVGVQDDPELTSLLSAVFHSGFQNASGVVDDIYLFSKELELCEVQSLFHGNMYSLSLAGGDNGVTANVPSQVFSKPFTVSMLVWPEEQGKNYELLSSESLSISIELGHWSIVIKSGQTCACEPCSDIREFKSSVPAVAGKWSMIEVSYDGSRLSLYLNGNEMDFMDFATESFPHVQQSEISLFTNFKGLVNAIRISDGKKQTQEKHLCPLKMDTVDTLHYFNFDYPFLGTQVLDLAAKGVFVSIQSPAALTEVSQQVPDPLLTTVEGTFSSTSGTPQCFRIEAYTSCGRHFHGSMSSLFDVTFSSPSVTLHEAKDLQSGVYEVCYVSNVCGEFDYNILYNANQVKSGKITVAAGPLHPGSTSIQIPNKCTSVKQDIVITARDSYGCIIPRNDLVFDVSFVGPSSPIATITHAPEISAGSYKASYIPEAEGNYQVTVKVNGALAGSVNCAYHCPGHSLEVDGYGGVEFVESSMYSPLDLADTSFTMMAWVRRGPVGPKPEVQETVGDEVVGGGRRSLQQTTTADPPSSLNHYVFFKGDDTQLGNDIKGYFMAFSNDWTQLTAGVYVPNQVSINQLGEYRLVTTTDGLQSMAVAQDLTSDDGWVHVCAVYDGETFKLYVGGSLRTTAQFQGKKFGQANSDSRPLSLGLNFAGQIDEAYITQKALSSEAIASMMYCPMNTNNLGVDVAAYIPFNEGPLNNGTTLFRGIGSSSSGSFDPLGHAGRTTFGRSRPGSKVGLTLSGSNSYTSNTTLDAMASVPMVTRLYLKDECNFAYLQDTTQNLQGFVNTFEYNNFKSSEPLFSNDRQASMPVPMTEVAFTHHKSIAGLCASTHYHSATSTLFTKGSYTMDYRFSGISIAKVDVHISASNFSTSTSDISGSSTVEVGKPSYLLVTLRDLYGNVLEDGSYTVNVVSLSQGFVSSPGDYLGDGMYKVKFHTTSPAPSGGFLLKVDVSGTQLDSSFLLNTNSPQPLELPSTGGPEGLYESDTVVAGNAIYVLGGAKANGQYSEDLWRLSFDDDVFYHKHKPLYLGDASADISIIEVDTESLAEISPDCSGIAFVSDTGELLKHYLHPNPGCKSVRTKFYVEKATGTTYMHYDSDAADLSDVTSVFGGVVTDFESFKEASYEGEGSLYLAPGSEAFTTQAFSLASKFTIEVAFYDAMATGSHLLTIASASGSNITLGTDVTYSGSYLGGYSGNTGSDLTWNTRSRDWHTLSVISDGQSVVASVDGVEKTLLQGADFVPTSISLSASESTSLCLWDQLVISNKTARSTSVSVGSFQIAAYLSGMKWDNLNPNGSAPFALFGQELVSYGGKLFVFGGERSGYISGSVHTYVESSNTWTYSDPKGAQPPARMSYSGCTHENLLYVFGGKTSTGEVLNDLWIFNMDTEEWTEETSKTYVADTGLYATGQLGGVHGHSCSIVNGSMVLFGGFMKVTQQASSATAVLDLKTYHWTAGSVGPPGRFSHTSVKKETSGSLFIFGGVNEKYAEFSDLWEYNLRDNRWSQLSYKTSIPVYNSKGGVFDHSAVELRGKMLAFGGQGYGQSYQSTLALPLYNIL